MPTIAEMEERLAEIDEQLEAWRICRHPGLKLVCDLEHGRKIFFHQCQSCGYESKNLIKATADRDRNTPGIKRPMGQDVLALCLEKVGVALEINKRAM